MAGERISGRCLCGAARFSAVLSDGFMSVCHCGMCRRWTSGVFMSLAVKPASLSLDDDRAFRRFASSARAERGFCATCGSPLFWRALDGSSADVSVQAVEDPSRFPFELEIYMDEKPHNYDFASDRRRLTGAEWRAAKETARG